MRARSSILLAATLAALGAVAAVAGVAPAGAAAAAAQPLLPATRYDVALTAISAQDCATRAAAAGPGVAHRRLAAPARGVLAARLRGPAGSDWDLALVDARTGRALNGAAGTGAREVAAARVRPGQRIVVQVCRRGGAGTAGRVTVRTAQGVLVERSAPAAAVAPDPRAAGRLPSGRTRYRTLPELQLELKALAAANPDIVRVFTLPLRSTEGREIMGVEIAAGVAGPPDGRPASVVAGTLHAREWPSADASVEWAHELVQGYRRGDARLAGIVGGARTHILPVLNVDGFDATLAAAGLHPDGSRQRALQSDGGIGTGAMKRKSCSVPGGTAVPCLARAGGPDLGVDLNRNFGPRWGGPGGDHEPFSPAYAGSRPFSEPETEGLRRWLRDLHPAVFVANHSFSGLVLRPPGTPGALPSTEEARLRALADAMAAATGYDSIPGYELYPVTGAVDDYVALALGGLAFTIEIGRRGFHPRFATGVARQYDAPAGGLREAFTLAGEAAVDAGSHGILRGTAPPGSVLRLEGRAVYETDARARTIREPRAAALVVPADGRFAWHVTPSDGPGAPAGRWALACTDALGRVLERRRVAVARGAVADLVLTCGASAAGT